MSLAINGLPLDAEQTFWRLWQSNSGNKMIVRIRSDCLYEKDNDVRTSSRSTLGLFEYVIRWDY